MKTIFFERALGVDIKSFKTTMDVNKHIERIKGRKMKVVKLSSPVVIRRGGTYEISSHNIDELVDKALNEPIKLRLVRR